MKQKSFGLMTLVVLLLVLTSCESLETNILQLRWGIVEDGVPTAGTSNINYYVIKDAYEAVKEACMKSGGDKFIMASVEGEGAINMVEKREVQKKINYIVSDAKGRIEAAKLAKLWTNRTFRIEYRFGNSGDWTQAYEYVYPSDK